MGFRSLKEDHNYCTISARDPKPNCGSPKQGISGYQQLETGQISIPEDRANNGRNRDRSIRGSVKFPEKTLYELETRPICRRGGRAEHHMEEHESVRVSTVLSDKQNPIKNSSRGNNSDHDNTNMVPTTLVPIIIVNEHRKPNTDTIISKAVDVSDRRITPIVKDKRVKFGSMETVRPISETIGLSQSAKELVNNARRSGTRTVYKSAWQRWVRWCCRKQLNPVQAPLVNIMNFLAENSERVGYSTINTYRSAISLYHETVGGVRVGKHPDVKDLMAGIFNTNPPKPRYTCTWDVDKVLQFWVMKGPNANLDQKLLTLKLVSLLALVFAARGHELKLLDLTSISRFHDKLIFHILEVTKTSGPGKPLKSFELLKYPYSENLNPVTCFEAYCAQTAAQREQNSIRKPLFLSYVQPHKPVKTSTIAGWLKTVMKKSGIDINRFKAHSTRGASTSKIGYAGLTINEICKLGDWSNARVFHKFYNREIEGKTSTQRIILNMT